MRSIDQKKYTKEYFVENCEGHEDWQNFGAEKLSPRLEATFKLGEVKKGMRVLDFGSGRGELAYQAALLGANVIGLDYSEVAISLSKRIRAPKNGRLSFKLLVGHKLPIEDRSVDLIFFVDVIEHLYPEEVRVILAEFRRVLVKGGRVIMHTSPNKDFYDIGYKYFTRFANMLANLLLWPILFHEMLVSSVDPRTIYEKAVHVNECNQKMVREYFERAGLKADVWLSSEFRLIRIRDKVRYLLLQPQVGFLKRWFAYDLWAIAKRVE